MEITHLVAYLRIVHGRKDLRHNTNQKNSKMYLYEKDTLYVHYSNKVIGSLSNLVSDITN